jgi:CheY-like chemotaxis protein
MISAINLDEKGSQFKAPKRVLVVDDDPCIQEMIQTILKKLAGWQVITADTGLEGLQKVASEKPDAIIVDFIMPGMDGLEFLHRLRQLPDGQSIPVVLLTGKIGLTQPHVTNSMDIVGALPKPLNPHQLLSQLTERFGW